MSFDDVTPAAEKWLAEFDLPPSPGPGIKDLKGQRVVVTSLLTDDDIRFFFPKRSVPWHLRMVKAVAVALRKRGAKIDRVAISPESYARWLDRQEEKTDSPERRYQYATRCPELPD